MKKIKIDYKKLTEGELDELMDELIREISNRIGDRKFVVYTGKNPYKDEI